MARVAIVGAGAMGLAAAYHALEAGHEVTVYEADKVAGGMAAHFDFSGLSIERYYHFVCKADQPTFRLMDELGIGDRMRWVKTSMAYYLKGRLHRWGDPVALLRFPHLSLVEKLRYGLMMFLATKRREPGELEHVSAREWIERWCGKNVYDLLWRRLFELKFYDRADPLSAAWIWTRIKRVGTSRQSMMQEELGYIDGGSETLVTALVRAIESRGGTIRLGTPVQKIVTEGSAVRAVVAGGETHAHDAVICTTPVQFIPDLVPDLPEDWKAAYRAIDNIGVMCLIFKLKRSVTPHFWVNVSDPECPIPGFVEFSNLRPVDTNIVYVPYYMPVTHEKWGMSDDALREEAFAVLQRANPALGPDDIIDYRVGRLRYAQPVCPPDFASKIPPLQTPIAGLQVADTCYYYPEDRGIAESVRYGEMLAKGVGGGQAASRS